MIVKITGSQMGFLAAAEEGGGVRREGMGESGQRRSERVKPTLESTTPKARSRSREDAAMYEAPGISSLIDDCFNYL